MIFLESNSSSFVALSWVPARYPWILIGRSRSLSRANSRTPRALTTVRHAVSCRNKILYFLNCSHQVSTFLLVYLQNWHPASNKTCTQKVLYTYALAFYKQERGKDPVNNLLAYLLSTSRSPVQPSFSCPWTKQLIHSLGGWNKHRRYRKILLWCCKWISQRACYRQLNAMQLKAEVLKSGHLKERFWRSCTRSWLKMFRLGCGFNPTVWPFKWKLLNSFFLTTS